ncbi:hypothetical protein QR680_006878 [Steinernema hermaphroditum]|uniref:SCP domain-containing protein n=1 Tax=Steinernema hermaphroditum TaxID=289476 RepID=A0AA39HWS6_9BILA|nr:hypothetical protein QR680_006878 [Steinernema hermaphroditum]
MISSVLILSLAVTVALGQHCPTQGLNPATRKAVLDRHNQLRSSSALGREKDGRSGHFAPPAKNMYKLEYDCELERMAQNWANRCVYQHSGQNVGENIFKSSSTAQDDSFVLQATDLWWNELAEKGVSRVSPNYKFTRFLASTFVGHYTQMAWARTTKIGCGHARCPTMNFVVCNYSEQGNWLDEQIYEIGSPCKRDSDCTTFANSRCSVSEGLCIKP